MLIGVLSIAGPDRTMSHSPVLHLLDRIALCFSSKKGVCTHLFAFLENERLSGVLCLLPISLFVSPNMALDSGARILARFLLVVADRNPGGHCPSLGSGDCAVSR